MASSAGSSKSIFSARSIHRQQRAQGVWPPREHDVERGQADVQVLAVQHDQQEPKDDPDVQQHADRLDAFVGELAKRLEHPATISEANAPPGYGKLPVLTLRRGRGKRPDHVEDHEEH